MTISPIQNIRLPVLEQSKMQVHYRRIIPLGQNANEHRAIRRIEIQHGIKIDAMDKAFVDAIRASFVEPESEDLQIELSDPAANIFDALNLQFHQKKKNVKAHGD